VSTERREVLDRHHFVEGMFVFLFACSSRFLEVDVDGGHGASQDLT
jgi:hypothetical protein